MITAALVLAAGPAAACDTALTVQIRNDRPLVDVAFDGHAARMVLDTGARETTFFSDAPSRLGLEMDDKRPAEQGMSFGQPFDIRFAKVRSVTFAGRTSASEDLAVIADGATEAGVDGFFNDDRLQQADYDLAHGHVDLGCDDAPDWTHGPGVSSVPLEAKYRFFGPAVVNGQTLRVLFDTGSPESSMTLAAAKRAGIKVDGAPDAEVHGMGPTGLHAWTAHVAEIRLGDEQAHDVAMQVIDKPNASADMIAGFDFFLSHRVWIDRRHNRLVFAPVGDPKPF